MSYFDDFLKCFVDNSPLIQIPQISFPAISAYRKYWKEQGHQKVPHPDCSCGFSGSDKPDHCKHHIEN